MKEEVFGISTEQINVKKENDFFMFKIMNSYGKEQNVTKGKTWKWDEGMRQTLQSYCSCFHGYLSLLKTIKKILLKMNIRKDSPQKE